MLQVDAVVQLLGVMPRLHESPVLKLRHGLERDVLLPAQRRRLR